MSRIDVLKRNYQRVCDLPWDRNVAGAQRVWLAVYDKEDERRLRLRVGLFEEATMAAGRRWRRCDLTDAFADWFTGPANADYARSYFESPDLVNASMLEDFKAHVAGMMGDALASADDAPANTIVAVTGVASLFGFARLSEVLPAVESRVRGRLLVFFPGVYEQN